MKQLEQIPKEDIVQWMRQFFGRDLEEVVTQIDRFSRDRQVQALLARQREIGEELKDIGQVCRQRRAGRQLQLTQESAGITRRLDELMGWAAKGDQRAS